MGEEFASEDLDDINDIRKSLVHLIAKYDEIEDTVDVLTDEYPEKIRELEKKLDEVTDRLEKIAPSNVEKDESTDQELLEQLKSQSELSDVPDSLKSVIEYDEPDTEYEDIGGLEEVVRQVREMVEWPLTRSDELEDMNVDVPPGVLLHGPPGTGKTMISRAVANETESQFIKVSGPELVQGVIGETPENIRELFKFARDNAPCILLFDEIDSIAMDRSADLRSGERGMNRTVSQLLTEIDGFASSDSSDSDSSNNVRLIGTTNKKENIDSALLRPGRLGRTIEVPKPDADAIREIFEQYTEEMPTEELNFSKLVYETRNMTGADIESICNDAGIRVIRDNRDQARQQDFIRACEELKQYNGRR